MFECRTYMHSRTLLITNKRSNVRNLTFGYLCAKPSFRIVCARTLANQNLHWAIRIFTGPILDSHGCKISSFGQRRLIRLRECAGRFESSFGVRKYGFSCYGWIHVRSILFGKLAFLSASWCCANTNKRFLLYLNTCNTVYIWKVPRPGVLRNPGGDISFSIFSRKKNQNK